LVVVENITTVNILGNQREKNILIQDMKDAIIHSFKIFISKWVC